MARYRTIKPETFTDAKLVTVPRDVRLLFIGLWSFVDDMGRKQYSPRQIKLELFPADNDVSFELVDKWMRLLEKAGLLRIYTIEDDEFFWLPRFRRHQRVDRPTHSYLPPHPKDPNPRCQCFACKLERGEVLNPRSKNGRKNDILDDNSRRADSTSEFDENARPVGREVGSKAYKLSTVDKNIYIRDATRVSASRPSAETSEATVKDRRAAQAAVDSLARGILKILHLDANPNILGELTDSIRIRSRGVSPELAAQQIAGRAALANRDAAPDSWTLWFADARYDYVNASDKRLTLRGEVVRPTCGGSICSNGWEVVSVGDRKYSRRCGDCARLWEGT